MTEQQPEMMINNNKPEAAQTGGHTVQDWSQGSGPAQRLFTWKKIKTWKLGSNRQRDKIQQKKTRDTEQRCTQETKSGPHEDSKAWRAKLTWRHR